MSPHPENTAAAATSMYENLLSLPLFKGVSRDHLSQMVGTARLSFLKFPAGETVHRAGEQCLGLTFILAGRVRLVTANHGDRVRVSQTLTAPAVISPDFLFGRNTTFPATATAIESVSLMHVSKADVLKLLNLDEVFSFNYLNLLSTNAQKAVDGMLAVTSGALEERIAFWLCALTQSDSDDIVLTAKHRDLYLLFGVQRSAFIGTLDSLKERGLLDYSAHEIRITSRKSLRDILLKRPD